MRYTPHTEIEQCVPAPQCWATAQWPASCSRERPRAEASRNGEEGGRGDAARLDLAATRSSWRPPECGTAVSCAKTDIRYRMAQPARLYERHRVPVRCYQPVL